MKTKFILHGGRLKYENADNDSYFREVLKGFEDGDKLLLIGWARRDEEVRAQVYAWEADNFLSRTEKNIEILHASRENLIEQIKQAKAIHITGGKSPELIADLKKYPDFIENLKGKTVGGSSAGACLFSTYYFYTDIAGVLEGLGVLPIRLKVHYGNPRFGDVDQSLALLKSCPENLELVLLRDSEWVVKEAEV